MIIKIDVDDSYMEEWLESVMEHFPETAASITDDQLEIIKSRILDDVIAELTDCSVDGLYQYLDFAEIGKGIL